MSKEIVKNEEKKEKEIVYNVGDQEVKLSSTIVNNFLVRGNKVTQKEAVAFMMLCKARNLNPFTNEAYLVKFKDDAQIIVSKEAFMRKAEINPNYEGHECGIIVNRNGDIIELPGAFKLKTDVLLGAWAKVYVNNKRIPIYISVSIEEYTKGQSTWKSMPCTMIRKVALVQALREAFPSDLGAMHTNEELGVDESQLNKIEVETKDIIEEQAFKEEVEIYSEPVQEVEEVEEVEVVKEVPKNDELGF